MPDSPAAPQRQTSTPAGGPALQQSRRPTLGRRLLIPLIGLCVFTSAVLITEFANRLVAGELEARTHADTLGFAGNLRAGIDRELNSILFISSGLSAYLTVRRDSLDEREVNAILKQLFDSNRHVRNFGVAVGHRLTYIYPRAGNEAAIGLNYPDQPQQWPAVQRAIDSNRGTLAGPLTLVQGGEGLIFRVPVRVDGHYWGLLSTVIDPQSLFRTAIGELGNAPYDFAIRGRDGLGWHGETFLGDTALFDDERTVTLAMEVPNGQWVIAARPRVSSGTGNIGLMLRGMGLALALLLALATVNLLRHRAELARLALFDPLTALPNRRYLEDNCSEVIDTGPIRGPRSHSGLLFIDLDGFKLINDRHGHKAGDAVLKIVGERICSQVRSGDTVARWGGDELVVVVPESNFDDLGQLSQRLRQVVEQPIEFDGLALQVGASIGWALPPEDGGSLRELLKVADQRMYEQKTRRKGAG